MRLVGVAVVVAVAGCGRFGFETHLTGEAGTIGDGVTDGDLALPGLLARYPLDDEPIAGTLVDAGKSGHDAHCSAGLTCPTHVPGHIGGAAHFDGSTQFARVLYGPWMNTPTGFTFAAWVYLDSYVDQVAFGRRYMSGSDDTFAFVSWQPGSSGTCWESEVNPVTKQNCCAFTIDLPLATWTHVAGRWTGTKKSLFISGVKQAEINAVEMLSDPNDIMIGSDENDLAPAYYWHGSVDELQLYDRGLTDAEILGLSQL